MSKLIPKLFLMGAASSAAVLPLVAPANAAQTFTVQEAAEKAKVTLNPGEGVYIQLPASMPIFTYSIDDGSVLTLGDKFSSGTNILRVVGKNPGKTGLGLVVQGSAGYQTLNFSVQVGSKGSQGTIQIQDGVPEESSAQAKDAALSSTSYPSGLVRSGLSLANIQGQIPKGSPLDLAVNQWINAVQQGTSETDATRQTGVQSDVLQRLTELGQSSPVASAPPETSVEVASVEPEASPEEDGSVQVEVQIEEEPPAPFEEASVEPEASPESQDSAFVERIAVLEAQVKSNTELIGKQKDLLAQVKSQQQTFLARFDAIDDQSEQFLAQLGDIKEPTASSEPAEPPVTAAVPEPAPEPPVEETEPQSEAAPESLAEAPESKPEAEEPAEEDSLTVTASSSEEVDSVQLAHAIKAGLHLNSKDYPYRSSKYKQVNNAVLILKRGNSLETASKSSGLELDTLLQLADSLPMKVSQGGAQ